MGAVAPGETPRQSEGRPGASDAAATRASAPNGEDKGKRGRWHWGVGVGQTRQVTHLPLTVPT